MQPSEIRTAPAKRAAAFLEEGRGVDQAHLRMALANALERIDRLERNIPGSDACKEILDDY